MLKRNEKGWYVMLGKGVYTIAEVSKLTQMNYNRVRSWFKPRTDGKGQAPIFHSDYKEVDGDFAVSFYDLIDVLVAGQFRDKYSLSMKTIRRAYQVLQDDLQTPHPFCHFNLYTDGKTIFHEAADEIDDKSLKEVVSKQYFFHHIKEKLDSIDYCQATKLAERWNISIGVTIDPLVSFGKPTVENTRILTYVLANQYYANNKNVNLVSELYGVSNQDVKNAVKFQNRYKGKSAA